MASKVLIDMSSMALNMPGMTMSITVSAPSSTISESGALSTAGVNMTNATEQFRMDFLTKILDDTELQFISNSYARRYWYGVVVVIGLAAVLNIVMRVASHWR
jgi:ferric-chelate reductase